MIYVDELREWPSGEWCHMWHANNDLEALHAFAETLGLERKWLHESRGISGFFPHYDLTPVKRKQALAYGAQPMELAEWIKGRLKDDKSPT